MTTCRRTRAAFPKAGNYVIRVFAKSRGVSGPLEVLLVSGNRRTTLTRAGEEFAADVSAPVGEYVIYAKYGAAGNYLGLLRYVGR